jgi:Rod binding domain-containing protein
MTLSISPQLNQLSVTPGSAQASPGPSKLTKAAREFESILLQNWLEKMNQSFAGADQSQDAAHDTVSSLGTQAISTALAARGGIGIASMLLRQLQPKEQPVQEVGSSPAEAGIHREKAIGR